MSTFTSPIKRLYAMPQKKFNRKRKNLGLPLSPRNIERSGDPLTKLVNVSVCLSSQLSCELHDAIKNIGSYIPARLEKVSFYDAWRVRLITNLRNASVSNDKFIESSYIQTYANLKLQHQYPAHIHESQISTFLSRFREEAKKMFSRRLKAVYCIENMRSVNDLDVEVSAFNQKKWKTVITVQSTNDEPKDSFDMLTAFDRQFSLPCLKPDNLAIHFLLDWKDGQKLVNIEDWGFMFRFLLFDDETVAFESIKYLITVKVDINKLYERLRGPRELAVFDIMTMMPYELYRLIADYC